MAGNKRDQHGDPQAFAAQNTNEIPLLVEAAPHGLGGGPVEANALGIEPLGLIHELTVDEQLPAVSGQAPAKLQFLEPIEERRVVAVDIQECGRREDR